MIENSIYFIDPFVIKDETAEEQAIAFQLTEGWRNDDLAVPFDVLDLYPVEKVKRAMAHLCSECWSWTGDSHHTFWYHINAEPWKIFQVI